MQRSKIATASVIAVAALTLTACGGQAPPADTGDGVSGDITVTSWRFADPSAIGQTHVELIDAFNDSQDAIRVTPEAVPYPDVNTQLINSVLSGSPADVVAIGPSELAANAEYLQPIDEFWEAEGSEFADLFSDTAKALATHDGKIWGIPVEMSTADGMWYNKEVLAEAGVDPEQAVASRANFLEALQKIEDSGNQPMLLEGANATRMDRHWSWYVDGGADLTDPANYVSEMCSSESLATFEFLTGLALDGYVPNPAAIGNEEANRQWSAGGVGFYTDGPWGPRTYEAFDASIVDKIGLTHLPPAEEGGKLGVNVDGLLWVIPKGSANPEAGWEFIKYMVSEEAQRKMTPNGSLPTLVSLSTDPVVTDDPVLEAFGAAIEEHGYPRPRASFIAEFKQIFMTAFQSAVTGQQPPADAHASACSQLQNID